MSYRKVGGLHFVRLGRFGFSFFLSRRRPAGRQMAKLQRIRNLER